MLPFEIKLQPGKPAYEQVTFAAKRAMASGQLAPGDPFPSLRVISKELKINPNTVQKVVSQLKAEGLLVVVPGVGTVVSEAVAADPTHALATLRPTAEGLAVEAHQLSLTRQQLLDLVAKEFDNLTN